MLVCELFYIFWLLVANAELATENKKRLNYLPVPLDFRYLCTDLWDETTLHIVMRGLYQTGVGGLCPFYFQDNRPFNK